MSWYRIYEHNTVIILYISVYVCIHIYIYSYRFFCVINIATYACIGDQLVFWRSSQGMLAMFRARSRGGKDGIRSLRGMGMMVKAFGN